MKSPKSVNCERLVSCAPLNELEIFSLDELYVLSPVENFVATFKFIARYFASSFLIQI